MTSRCVYVMRDADGYAKIGMSRNIPLRLAALKYERKSDISVVFSREAGEIAASVEMIAHTILASKRQYGEWFSVNIDEAIAAVVEAFERVAAGDLSLKKRLSHNRGPGGGTQPVSIRFDHVPYDALRQVAEAEDRSISSVVRRIVDEWIARKKEARGGKGTR